MPALSKVTDRGARPILALGLLCVAACQEGDIRTYSAPKDTAAPMSLPPPRAPAPETVAWTLPSGWRELPGEGLRFATLVVEDGTEDGSRPPLEMRVTPLGMAARDPLANVNRWRTQIGLAPIDASQLGDDARELEIDGRRAHLVRLVGEPGEHESPHEILAAIVPGDELVWFFMMLDHVDRVAKHEAAFEEFMRSVRVQPAEATAAVRMPEGHPPTTAAPPTPATGADVDAAAQAAAGVDWTTPDGWHAHPGNGSFRIVSFHVGADPAPAEVTITRFAGGAGALLPNINRWRGQIGLGPVASVAEQALERVEIAGDEAQLLDLADSSSADPNRARMLVALLARGDTAWFIKMTGPHQVLETQRPTFVGFARSLRFQPEHS